MRFDTGQASGESRVAVTIDLDWACEPAVEDLLGWLSRRAIPATVFATHRSPTVESLMPQLEVGLHPFFDPTSSHGSTLADTIAYVLGLPHNLAAYRCHRFVDSNPIRAAMVEAGMTVCSNVCTDLEIIRPFRDRFGLLEVPIFMEDGGYLHSRRPLDSTVAIEATLAGAGLKLLALHPMHFAVNTPKFSYMEGIKRSRSREAWRALDGRDLKQLSWTGRGIRDLVIDVFEACMRLGVTFTTLGRVAAEVETRAPAVPTGLVAYDSTATSRA